MKISCNWLREYIKTDLSPEEIARRITLSGIEVENIYRYESIRGNLEGVVIGQVRECEKHPNADRLKLTKVEVGNGNLLQIVCGAPNVTVGQKVAVALVGSTLYPKKGEPLIIKKTKIRGIESEGMICAEDEIGIGEMHEGIMVLQTELLPGSPSAHYFQPVSDTILEIGLTPNRIDAASHIGVARELKALLGRELVFPPLETFNTNNKNHPVEISIKNTNACKRYAGVTLCNVKVGPSPNWLAEKLKSIGLTPINNIVDVTNFVLHECGQPLHAFDYDEITGNKIIIKNLPDETPFITLEGTARKLRAGDLMICNEKEPMCIAGVFGGIKSGIKETTSKIFLESAWFSPETVSKTARHHGLNTDASFRFSRGTDPEMVIYALKRAALLIKEITGAEISSPVYDIYPEPIQPFRITLRIDRLNKLAGKNLDKKNVTRILNDLEFIVSEENDKEWNLIVPLFRPDVTREADVIEEVLRIYGYENIPVSPKLNSSLQTLSGFGKEEVQKKISRSLSALGFSEIITNSLISGVKAVKVYGKDFPFINLVNPLSEEYNVMRPDLLISGLQVIAYNKNRQNHDLKIYEFGAGYVRGEVGSRESEVGSRESEVGSRESEVGSNPYCNELYNETQWLALFITGKSSAVNWYNPNVRDTDVFLIKSHGYRILQQMGISGTDETDINDTRFSNGRVISKGNMILGKYGKINPAISMKVFDLDEPVFFAEINWEAIVSLNGNFKIVHKDLPKYPAVTRDLALVINKSVSYHEIKKVAFQHAGNTLKALNIFDLYEGEHLGEGKKSAAINLILQDENKTMTDKEIQKTIDRMVEGFQKELGAVLRGDATQN